MSGKNSKKIVLLLSVSVVFCLLATSCLSILATVGGIIFNYSDHLSENRVIVYGDKNDIAVTFLDGKMLATWDESAPYNYTLTVTDGLKKDEYSVSGGSFDLTAAGYSYKDDLKLDLNKSGGVSSTYYSYRYKALSDSDYNTYTKTVDAGFSEIDRYIATRAEWFEFFSYLIIFREGAEEGTDEDGTPYQLVDTNCYLAYDYTAYPDYAGLQAEECLENEVCSAIDAYEDSAAYAYSYSLGDDQKTVRLYLKFYYDNAPDLESDTSEKYANSTKPTDRAHYSMTVRHTRKFYIDSVEKTIPVKSSDQLYFALKKGYRPLPVSGSAADLLYVKMRFILSYINSDRDSDVDKLHYIYDYIVNTVIYDYTFTNRIMDKTDDSKTLFRYKCLYLEGVFGMQSDGTFDDSKRVAICDGLSKAYMCMATIEGIPCLKISGKVNGEGHAWNKAKVGGNWYLVDTTWGNALASNANVEYLTHDYFLVKDDTKHVENPYITYPAATKNYKKEATSGSNPFGFDFFA